MANRNDFVQNAQFRELWSHNSQSKNMKTIVRNIMFQVYFSESVRRHTFFTIQYSQLKIVKIRIKEGKLTKRMLRIEFSVETFNLSAQHDLQFQNHIDWIFRKKILKIRKFARRIFSHIFSYFLSPHWILTKYLEMFPFLRIVRQSVENEILVYRKRMNHFSLYNTKRVHKKRLQLIEMRL